SIHTCPMAAAQLSPSSGRGRQQVGRNEVILALPGRAKVPGRDQQVRWLKSPTRPAYTGQPAEARDFPLPTPGQYTASPFCIAGTWRDGPAGEQPDSIMSRLRRVRTWGLSTIDKSPSFRRLTGSRGSTNAPEKGSSATATRQRAPDRVDAAGRGLGLHHEPRQRRWGGRSSDLMPEVGKASCAAALVTHSPWRPIPPALQGRRCRYRRLVLVADVAGVRYVQRIRLGWRDEAKGVAPHIDVGDRLLDLGHVAGDASAAGASRLVMGVGFDRRGMRSVLRIR